MGQHTATVPIWSSVFGPALRKKSHQSLTGAVAMRHSSQLDLALWYGKHGFPVFPCKPLGKQPLTQNGHKDASVEPKQILSWWRDNPTANIGIPTGEASGFFVLDIDREYGGEESWEVFAPVASFQELRCRKLDVDATSHFAGLGMSVAESWPRALT